MKKDSALYNELIKMLKEQKQDSLENLTDVKEKNSWMSGAYQGELDAYNYVYEWLTTQLYEVEE